MGRRGRRRRRARDDGTVRRTSAFGTADKAVLAISIVGVALVLGWFLGRASADRPLPIVVGFLGAGFLGVAAQMGEPGAAAPAAVAATLASIGIGIGLWYGIV